MRTTHIRGVAAVVAAASLTLTAALASASAASAKATPASTAGAHQAVVAHHGAVPNSPAATSNLGAGYFISMAGVSSISAQFTMPAFSCANSDDYEWLLPGIWTFSGGSVTYTQSDVNFNCEADGTTFQTDGPEVPGGAFDESITPQPGDKIRVSLAFTPSSTTASFTDVTQDLSVQLVGDADTGDTALIGEANFVNAEPTFTKVVFTQVKVNGLPLADYESSRYSLQSNSDVQISTGNIRHDGKSFVTTFRNNY